MALSSKNAAGMSASAPNGQKPLIELNGRPAVSYLLDNLRRCALISSITLVTDSPDYSCCIEADSTIFVDGDLEQAVLAGINSSDAGRCLMMAADMPLASAQGLSDLLQSAPDCDVVYPVVGRADMVRLLPHRTAYYVNTKEGSFTGSSCLLFDSQVALSRQSTVSRLMSARSNPKELISLLGPKLVMKLMLTKVSTAELEAQLSAVLDVSCKMYVTSYPEMLVSIDTLSDVSAIEALLN